MSPFSPFERLARTIRSRVASERAMRRMGADLSSLEPGGATLSVARRPELVRPDGAFESRVTAFLLDQGTKIAAATRLSEGQTCLSSGLKFQEIAPAHGDRLICRARVVRAGRLASVVAADVVCVSDGRETKTAVAIATVSIVDASALGAVGHA